MKYLLTNCLIALACMFASCNKSSPMLKGWPADIPQYPGSTVTNAEDISIPDLTFLMIMLESSDPHSAVVDYYDQQARCAGYKVFYLLRSKGSAHGAYVKDDAEFQIFAGNDGSGVNKILLRVVSPAEPIELHAAGALPATFPLLELSPYPNARIETAAARESEAVLIMESTDSFDVIADYYTSLYSARGFAVHDDLLGVLLPKEIGLAIEYLRDDVNILLGIDESLSGNTLIWLRAKTAFHPD